LFSYLYIYMYECIYSFNSFSSPPPLLFVLLRAMFLHLVICVTLYKVTWYMYKFWTHLTWNVMWSILITLCMSSADLKCHVTHSHSLCVCRLLTWSIMWPILITLCMSSAVVIYKRLSRWITGPIWINLLGIFLGCCFVYASIQ
jgi:hypothetical protein